MINFENKKIMIIAPHMDDEIIGCGGTILKYRSVISELSIVHMTFDCNREVEVQKVFDLLKVDHHFMCNELDGFVGLNRMETCIKIIDIIQTYKPDIVFIPHKNDNHNDHKATNGIAWDAIEKARYWNGNNEWHVRLVLEYEVWSFIEIVGLIENISEQIEQKKSIMGVYQSQLTFDYIRFIEYINGYRGLVCNRKGYAESFAVRSF